MATPTMITVVGDVQTPPGTADATFTVVLEQEVWLTHSDGTVIEPTKYIGVTNASGVLLGVDGISPFTAPATTDPAWLPQGWTYRVTFDPEDNLPQRAPFKAGLPHDAPSGVVTLGSLLPIPASGGSLFAPLTHTHPGDVTEDELDTALDDYPTTADLTAALADKVSKTGDTMSGALIVQGALTAGGTLLFRGYLDISGPPTSGTWTSGDVVFTKNGVYRCTVGGTPGTWIRLTEDKNNFGPQDHVLLHGWTFDPAGIQGTLVWTTAGLGRVFRVRPTKASITNICFHFTTGGTGLVAGQCFAAVYNANGALIGAEAVTVDQATNWASGGYKKCALVTPQSVVPYDDYQILAWYNGTTGPTVSRGGNSDTSIINASIPVSGTSPYRFSSANTGLTTAAPGNLAAKTGIATAWWCGVE